MSSTETAVHPQQPEADYWTLVELLLDGVPARWYCSSQSEIVAHDRRWLPKPDIQLDYAKQTGVLRESPTKVSMQMDPWLDALTGPDAQPPVDIRLFELRKDSDGGGVKTRFVGSVTRSYRNADGKRGLVRLECSTIKDLLDATLSATADLQCSNTFGGPGCYIDTAALTEIGLVSAASGSVLTLTGLSPVTDPAKGKYWHRGYVAKDGVRISIRDWDQSDPGRFVLVRPAPASWVTQSVSVTPGCDLFEGTCGARWGNLVHFNGRGKRMPDYNPTIEDPPA